MPESKRRKKKSTSKPEFVEASQKAASGPVKIGPSPWVAPAMIGFLVVGLLWIVVFYLAGNDIGFMQSLGNLWNVAIGFGLIGIGFALSTRWR